MSVVQSSLAELISLQRAAAVRAAEPPPAAAAPVAAPTSAPAPAPAPPAVPSSRPMTALPSQPSHPGQLNTQPQPPSHRPSHSSAHPASHPGPLGLHSGLYEPSLRSTPKTKMWRTSSNDRLSAPDRDREGCRSPRSPPPDTSALPSDDEDDPLEPSAVIYNNMLSLAEAARLKADGHQEGDAEPPLLAEPPPRTHPFDYDLDEPDEPTSSPPRPDHPHPSSLSRSHSQSQSRPRKRARLDDPQLRRALPMQRGDNTQFRNPVEMGFCSPEKGRELFDLFMQGGQIYVPIFDPEVDTWESLCERSPFAVTALIMVGSKIEDAGGPASELQKKCRDHAEMIGECQVRRSRRGRRTCSRAVQAGT